MKALSLYQPWATLTAAGAKRIETRSWSTRYRGPLAIHATSVHRAAERLVVGLSPFTRVLTAITAAQTQVEILSRLPHGVILATANLVDCLPIEVILNRIKLSDQELAFGDFAIGRFGWLFEDVMPLPDPIPAIGRQGLWEWMGGKNAQT